MQIGSLLKRGKDFLGHNENALLNCEILLSYVLGISREQLFMRNGEELEPALSKLFEQYLQRVSAGEPVAYITKNKEFFGLDFYVDERVLVPRPETELLVERGVAFLKDHTDARVLDVGTGSGNIAIALGSTVYENIDLIEAIDLSEEVLSVAKINVEQHCLTEKIHVFQSDLLNSLDKGACYDFIVTNLPYIGEKNNRYVISEVELYEPSLALFGGSDGLFLYKKLFQQLFEKQIEFDLFIGEFGFGQTKELEILLNKFFGHKWKIEQDLVGIDRMFVVTS